MDINRKGTEYALKWCKIISVLQMNKQTIIE